MPVLRKTAPATTSIKVLVEGEETVWHLRRVTAREDVEIQADLRSLSMWRQQRALRVQPQLARLARLQEQIQGTTDALAAAQPIDLDALDAQVSEVAAAMEAVDLTPPTGIVEVLISWLLRLVVSVDGYRTEAGDPLTWGAISDEDKTALLGQLAFAVLSELVAHAVRASHVSEVVRPKS